MARPHRQRLTPATSPPSLRVTSRRSSRTGGSHRAWATGAGTGTSNSTPASTSHCRTARYRAHARPTVPGTAASILGCAKGANRL